MEIKCIEDYIFRFFLLKRICFKIKKNVENQKSFPQTCIEMKKEKRKIEREREGEKNRMSNKTLFENRKQLLWLENMVLTFSFQGHYHTIGRTCTNRIFYREKKMRTGNVNK